MVTIPAALAIQRHDKQVGALQRLQHLLAVASLEQGIAQGRAEPLQYRGVQQEALDGGLQAAEHFLGQIVQDIALLTKGRSASFVAGLD